VPGQHVEEGRNCRAPSRPRRFLFGPKPWQAPDISRADLVPFEMAARPASGGLVLPNDDRPPSGGSGSTHGVAWSISADSSSSSSANLDGRCLYALGAAVAEARTPRRDTGSCPHVLLWRRVASAQPVLRSAHPKRLSRSAAMKAHDCVAVAGRQLPFGEAADSVPKCRSLTAGRVKAALARRRGELEGGSA
jgi:hypothetical protein